MAPTKWDDIIDSRDVIERIRELSKTNRKADKKELDTLLALADEGEFSSGWDDGETLIRYSYFRDYAQELAEECDMVITGACWPNNCIDWEWAAKELQNDYMRIEFDDIDYWIAS